MQWGRDPQINIYYSWVRLHNSFFFNYKVFSFSCLERNSISVYLTIKTTKGFLGKENTTTGLFMFRSLSIYFFFLFFTWSGVKCLWSKDKMKILASRKILFGMCVYWAMCGRLYKLKWSCSLQAVLLCWHLPLCKRRRQDICWCNCSCHPHKHVQWKACIQ